MKIYTRTGDTGTTGLWGGERVRKDEVRVESYGTVDECNAALGVARAAGLDQGLDELIERLQNLLFVVGSDLATPGEAAHIPRITAAEVVLLEGLIDTLEAELPPLRQFIMPGGSPGAAQLHLARTICRRAERLVVGLAATESVNRQVLIFLNRLSDLLFVAARIANARAGLADVPWQSPRLGGS
ncbi:MAG TPA: cob(I)yrinic acid a,c-diamide adenosyltransferase [Roseiflexaceae bacterium]|nr:cob(I)yrinic acid a,c-diamide adenosyltransferase [Roseiflexaceae bacterium]HMP39789.1 cob(I)yrinic acid a,c-diamide adenosyltransferase [Roseiflexaceae bacterium]